MLKSLARLQIRPSLVQKTQRHFHTRDTTAPGFYQYIRQPKTVSIIGAPLADGQPLHGVELGPQFIREGGLVDRLKADKWTVEDVGDLDFHSLNNSKANAAASSGKIKFANLVGPANKMIFDAVGSALKKKNLPVVLGGDHSVGIGSMAAVLKNNPETAIIWVDAHADINTPNGSASGNIHGMVLSFLMNLENARSTPGFEFLKDKSIPFFDPSRLVYIGLRDLDTPEKALIRSLNIRAFTMKDIDRFGISKVMEMAEDHVLNRVQRPIHLSFDIDSLDPAYAPSTGTRVSGGLSYREAYYICESVAETGMLSSMDLAEVNPELSSDKSQTEMTVKLAVGLISSALGNTIL